MIWPYTTKKSGKRGIEIAESVRRRQLQCGGEKETRRT